MTKEEESKFLQISKDLVILNNQYLTKKKVHVDRDFLVKPFVINEDMSKKKKQPKFIKSMKPKFHDTIPIDSLFMDTCTHGQRLTRAFQTKEPICRFLHHQNPYLKLGPFKEELKSERPYAVVFHDILTDAEMDYLIKISIPKLSRKRYPNGDISRGQQHEFRSGKKIKIVHKTVQAWHLEAYYNQTSVPKVLDPVLWRLAIKIGLATGLKTVGQHSGTPMQVTNYGLGGLCEVHIDPHGYLEGKDLTEGRKNLIQSGDMLGTFMAWLKDVEAGGGTAYIGKCFKTVYFF